MGEVLSARKDTYFRTGTGNRIWRGKGQKLREGVVEVISKRVKQEWNRKYRLRVTTEGPVLKEI